MLFPYLSGLGVVEKDDVVAVEVGENFLSEIFAYNNLLKLVKVL